MNMPLVVLLLALVLVEPYNMITTTLMPLKRTIVQPDHHTSMEMLLTFNGVRVKCIVTSYVLMMNYETSLEIVSVSVFLLILNEWLWTGLNEIST